MDTPVRWAVLGPGRMAAKFAADFAHVHDGELVAVASRSPERAQEFGARFGISRRYGSYAELLADEQVDAVYVSTPHAWHRAHGAAVIEAGKALLLEKAFTATLAGAQSLVELARARQTFVMEAMWTRFLPAMGLLRKVIADGEIGKVRGVVADLGVTRQFDPRGRLFDLSQGGGSLLDLGVYVVNLAQSVMGGAPRVVAAGSLMSTGVDYDVTYLLDYGEGRTASLHSSLYQTPGVATVFGDQGWIELPPRFHHPDALIVHRRDGSVERLAAAPTGHGYPHQVEHVNSCLRAGLTESPVMPLDDTLAVQTVLQQAADQVGVALFDQPSE